MQRKRKLTSILKIFEPTFSKSENTENVNTTSPFKRRVKLLKKKFQNHDIVTNSPVSGMFIKVSYLIHKTFFYYKI